MVEVEAQGKAFASSGILGGISVGAGHLQSGVETPLMSLNYTRLRP
ncbi:MAG: hypothetical protein ABSD42_11310 [Candidatus Bathyarchaeia archaeon]|jgi:hypothetical protein